MHIAVLPVALVGIALCPNVPSLAIPESSLKIPLVDIARVPDHNADAVLDIGTGEGLAYVDPLFALLVLAPSAVQIVGVRCVEVEVLEFICSALLCGRSQSYTGVSHPLTGSFLCACGRTQNFAAAGLPRLFEG